VRTHPDIALTTTLLQLVCRSLTTCAFLRAQMRPTYLLCLTPDDFTRQGESAATQWINLEILTVL
jgi:hypothetical protein